ncbi:MAG TPA: hypothetical protein HA263_05595 [Methanoregulaceae archaeon]|nr:hypothetical protein [Methanoregulaceae archaeon]
MTSGSLSSPPKEAEVFIDAPYGGLFGNTVLAHVIEEFIASPSVVYRPKDLEELTEKSEPSIRSALATLLRLNLIEKVSSENQPPRYRVRVESKKFVALSFLAYAMLDDRDGSDCMDMAVHDYYSNYVREKFESVHSYDISGTSYEIVGARDATSRKMGISEPASAIYTGVAV